MSKKYAQNGLYIVFNAWNFLTKYIVTVFIRLISIPLDRCPDNGRSFL